MPNTKRKRSKFVFTLSQQQLSALLDLARSSDQPIEELITLALDRYIEKELSQCQLPPNQ